jgi:hypothetical protein
MFCFVYSILYVNMLDVILEAEWDEAELCGTSVSDVPILPAPPVINEFGAWVGRMCLEKNVLLCHFIHWKSHMDYFGTELGLLWWEAGD